jgi:ligand-binding sensor domain-containing protein/signal transduction histidine kinase
VTPCSDKMHSAPPSSAPVPDYNGEPDAMVAAMIRAMIACTLLSACLLGDHAGALNSPPVAYSRRTWQMQDGLPEQTVQAFAQTRDRYLWIGTTGGLLRFDGSRFVLYNRENTPAFTENNVFALAVSRDDTLWIGTEGGGLIRHRGGVFRAFSNKDGLTNGFVRTIYQDHEGQIWIGTDNGLFRVSGDRVDRIDNTESMPAVAVHAIYQDHIGQLWVGGSRLLCLHDGESAEYRLEQGGSENRVKSILETRDYTIWVGTISGLHRMVAGDKFFHRVEGTRGVVRFLRETSDGTLWIGTIGHGIYKYRDGRFSQITAPHNLPSNTALNLFEDAENNLWIGTQAGMLRLSTTPVRTVALPDAGDYDAETVYQDPNGDLWVAAANLFRFREGKATEVRFPGVEGVRIRNVFRDSSGALWIGTEGRGVFRQNQGGLVHYTTKDGLVNDFVRAFLQTRDGSVWIATDEGVSRWRPDGFTSYQMRDGLCYFSTRVLAEDRNGDVWIGTDHGVSRLHDGSFASDPAIEALKDEKIWAIHEDSDGGLWFGTRTGGLYRWRSRTLNHYTAAQGLASNSIYEIVEDHEENFWISGPNGISVISRRELDLIADQPSHPLSLTLYGISDGLETTQLYGAEKPGGVVTSQGEVWFASNQGPVRISLDSAKLSDPVPVVIDDVLADGLPHSARQEITLSPDTPKVELHYSVVLLRSQERVRFRYKLEGFDKNWTDDSSGRVAYYTNLPAGKYQFRVAAFEMNNPQQVSETSVEIVQRPHFYRTGWFLSCCLLLSASAVWGGYRFRLRQLHARFEAVLNERARLAREMHDTLIQGCAGVSALLEAHSSLNGTEAQAKDDLLDTARTQLRTTIDESRAAVWDLRHGDGSAAAIGPLLENMSRQITHEFDIPVQYQLSGKPFDFDQTTAHELLMVAREALHNAVRHGQPTSVQLNVDFSDDACSVRIRDNGIGFDAARILASPNGHYGLVGMRERMKRLGGDFALTSHAGQGTELNFRVSRKTPTRHNAMPAV